MTERPRLYGPVLAEHLRRHRQMAFVSGARQVGKTTACRSAADTYLSWDNADDRRLLLRGPSALTASNIELVKTSANNSNTLGVSIPALRKLAKRAGRDHVLAQQLWESGIHEARILAAL